MSSRDRKQGYPFAEVVDSLSEMIELYGYLRFISNPQAWRMT